MNERQPTEPVMAFLLLGDESKSVCLGCSNILLDKGMLVKRYERPFGVASKAAKAVVDGIEYGPFTVIFYGIADGHTLAECQEEIGDRHIGPKWGT